jgi:hypothetical protein
VRTRRSGHGDRQRRASDRKQQRFERLHTVQRSCRGSRPSQPPREALPTTQ